MEKYKIYNLIGDYGMKLRTKFLVLLICIIIVPTIAVIGLTYNSINKSITKIETDKGDENIQRTLKYLDSVLANQGDSMNSWLPWTDLYDAVESKDTGWIDENVISSTKENTSNEVLIILDKDFNVLNESDTTPKEWKKSNLKDLGIIKNLNASNYFASDLELTADSAYVLSIGKIASNEDPDFKNYNGYIVNARKLTNIMINNGKEIMSADITLKFNNGYILSTLDNPNINDSKISKFIYKDKMIVEAEAPYVNPAGEQIGILHVETTSTSGIKALNTLANYSVILIIFILILASIMLLWLNSKIINPINRIINIIKHKDLNQLVQVTGNDEIAMLAAEFNGFINILMENFKNVKIAVDEVENLNNEFLVIYEEANQSMDHITSSIDNSTLFLNSNITELKNISRAAGEIDESSTEILSTLKMLKDDSEKINSSASKGMESLEEMSNVINETQSKFDATFTAINEFTQSVEMIHDFSELIREISAQSNLLALNASIEAARAGDEGKGFMVVAEEVRKLSVETEEVIEKIDNIITNILSYANESNSSINIVKTQLESTNIISNLTYEEVKSIISNVLSITKFVSEIFSKIQLQETVLADLNNKIEIINKSFENVNANFSEINETTHSQLLTANNLSKKAGLMGSTIESLDNIVKQFKGI